MEIVLHSYSDIITNSSTVTFMWPKRNADEILRDIIKEIMTTLEVDGEPEDYFRIAIEVDDANLSEREKALVSKLDIDGVYDAYNSCSLSYDEFPPDPPPVKITLVPKKPGSLDLGSKISKMFDVEGYYNG